MESHSRFVSYISESSSRSSGRRLPKSKWPPVKSNSRKVCRTWNAATPWMLPCWKAARRALDAKQAALTQRLQVHDLTISLNDLMGLPLNTQSRPGC